LIFLSRISNLNPPRPSQKREKLVVRNFNYLNFIEISKANPSKRKSNHGTKKRKINTTEEHSNE
jgi:hypothetical protein